MSEPFAGKQTAIDPSALPQRGGSFVCTGISKNFHGLVSFLPFDGLPARMAASGFPVPGSARFGRIGSIVGI
jgi:hypothetical protein